MTDEMLNMGEKPAGVSSPPLPRAPDPILTGTGPSRDHAARPTPVERQA